MAKASKEINDLIEKKAKEFGEEPAFIKAIVSVESDFIPIAASKAQARGLMQVTQPALADMNRAHKLGLTFDDMFDAEKNLTVGILYVQWLRNYLRKQVKDGNEKFLNVLVLMAYNWGIGNVIKWLRHLPIRSEILKIPEETKQYVYQVMWYYYHFAKEV